MTKLSVNVNKVATLRNTRPQLNIPDLVHCSKICLDAGAHGITVHPRPDHRHIKPDDVYALADLLKKYPHAEFNIEGNPFIDYMPIVEKVHPTQATLVPDDPQAKTSDHGWDLERNGDKLIPLVRKLKAIGCRVSLFMDADPRSMDFAPQLDIDRIELYTEPYATAFARGDRKAADAYAATAARAQEVGLEVNAGHDLSLANLPAFLAAVPNVKEVSIGHALVADALEFGLAETVRKYLRACGHSGG
jgi:pyridoxine 5-phosphate synthase